MVRAGSAALFALGCAAAVPGSAEAPVVTNGRLLSEGSVDASRLDDPAGGGTRTAFPWTVQHGDFRSDGAKLAFDDGGEIQVRNTDGSGYVFPEGTVEGQVTAVRFAPDDTSVLVASRTVEDIWSVHRVAPGKAPVRLWQVDGSTTLHDVTAVEVDDVSGRVVVVDQNEVWVMGANGESPSTVAPTTCTSACPDFLYGATWAPDGRLLVLSSWFDQVEPFTEHLEIGAYDPVLHTLTRLRSVPAQGRWRSDLIVAPDGTKVAWNVQDSPTDWTAVATLTGVEQPVRLTGGWHAAWQPCPDGVCPTFRLTPRPGKPGIGRASSGAVGGRLTMTARWAMPANARVAGVSSSKIIIAKLNSANRVTNVNVDIVLSATAVSKVLRGYSGRYKFRVRVHGEMGWSAYSAWSNIVRAR